MKITITNQDWQTKTIPVKDKTHKVLKNGKVIPTQLCMFRRVAKV